MSLLLQTDAHQVDLRELTPEDEELVYVIRRETMQRYVEETYGAWDDTVQREMSRNRMNLETGRILQIDGHDAGLLVVTEDSSGLNLQNIHLLPAWQNQGLGTLILRKLKSEAQRRRIMLRLQVLPSNPARFLYLREGFEVVAKRPTRWSLAFNPSQPEASALG